MEELIPILKEELIEALNLKDYTPEELDADAPLFGTGLGLDSIDSLEIMVMLERNYGIRIEDPREGRAILQNIRTMAEYITKHRQMT